MRKKLKLIKSYLKYLIMNSQGPKLTRYLYFKDEVVLSLLNALLEKKNLNECLFWISELYYSGYHTEVWDIMWTIYYDFYAIKNPKLEKHFVKIYKKWKINQDINSILSVVKNLYSNSISTPDVFCMRLLMKTQNTKAALGLKTHLPKTFKCSIKFKQILLSIYRKDYKNIAFNIKKFKGEELELFDVICQYIVHGLFEEIPKTSINEENKKIMTSQFLSHPYNNKLHIILSLIFNCYYNGTDFNERMLFIRASGDNITFVKDIDMIPCHPVYKTLACKRLYSISKDIGCFQLIRNNKVFPPYNEILWYHWIYFAFSTPLWHQRLINYNIKMNDKKYEISFGDDDELEDFHEKYGYEPDEQSKETQEKSILMIPDLSIKKWLADIFDSHHLIAFVKDQKYYY